MKVKFTECNRQQNKSNGQQHSQPEGRRRHQRCRSTDVRVVEQARVEDKHKHEVEDDAAPDGEMVEAGPVGRLQCALNAQCDTTSTVLLAISLKLRRFGCT